MDESNVEMSFRGNLSDRNSMTSRTNHSNNLGSGLLMTHSSSSTQTPEVEQPEGLVQIGSSLIQIGRRSVEGVRGPLGSFSQLERHTVEGSRLLRFSFSNVIEELRPLMQARPDSNTFNRLNPDRPAHTSQSHTDPNSFNWHNPDRQIHASLQSHSDPDAFNWPSGSAYVSRTSSSESHVINVEGNFDNVLTPATAITTNGNEGNINAGSGGNGPPGGPWPEESGTEATEGFPLNPEISAIISVIKKYLPFIAIILSKAIYDHIPAILLFLGLYGTFGFYNSRLKSEIASHANRNILFLLFTIGHLLVTIFGFYYLYDDMKLYLSLVFIPPYIQPLTVIDLIWLVAVTDFILKLITIIVKTCIALIPHKSFEAKKRGKWYLAVETTSQLYRSLVPIQPWLYYLLESYQGPQKVVGVFLSAAYMVSKGADLMSRARTWWTSMIKLIQNVQLGMKPDKDQLSSAGMTCPICHDDYTCPVLLSCQHVFCESCVARWFDREQTCPLCRAKVVDDPSWRDGGTTYFAQLF